MTDVREVGPEALDRWAEVPIRFVVRSRLVVTREAARFVLAEKPVDPPYEYDYDALELPTRWRLWDLSNWVFFEGLDGAGTVGRAAVAFRTPGLELLDGRDDFAALWDIRVRPECRGSGVGRALFEAAARWARARGATEMRVETQDINVPACRFYERQGCRLEATMPGVYAGHPEQVQLIWNLGLASRAIRSGS